MNDLTMLVRRELWENRSLYLVPVVFAGIVILAVSVGIVRGTAHVGDVNIAQQMGMLDAEMAGRGVAVLAFGLWMIFSMVINAVIFFYALDALYGDRKDRSVLFWKSLPITDTQTVLSKLATALLVAPAISIAVVLVTAFAVLIIMSVALLFKGVNPVVLWSGMPLFKIVGSMVSIELALSIWFLPFVAWLLFSSAVSRRTPFLIALLVPAGIAFAEKLAFNTSYFLDTIGDYIDRFYNPLFNNMEELAIREGGKNISVTGDLPSVGDVFSLLLDPVLLIGLAIGTTFVVLSIRARHRVIEIG